MNGARFGLSRRYLSRFRRHIIFKGYYKPHIGCRHSEGILAATVIHSFRNIFAAIAALITDRLGQYVGGTIRLDGSCNFCTCREAGLIMGLTISKCDSAFVFALRLN